jgi:hypothetical protein
MSNIRLVGLCPPPPLEICLFPPLLRSVSNTRRLSDLREFFEQGDVRPYRYSTYLRGVTDALIAILVHDGPTCNKFKGMEERGQRCSSPFSCLIYCPLTNVCGYLNLSTMHLSWKRVSMCALTERFLAIKVGVDLTPSHIASQPARYYDRNIG